MSSLKTESAFLENFDVRNYLRGSDRIPVRLISHGSGPAAKLHNSRTALADRFAYGAFAFRRGRRDRKLDHRSREITVV
jgi:hypothetical protein